MEAETETIPTDAEDRGKYQEPEESTGSSALSAPRNNLSTPSFGILE